MNKPIHRHFDNHRKTTMLYFDDEDHPRECYMRGGICFPIQYKVQDEIEINGFAVMAGQDVVTKQIYIFEQTQWVTIDDILSPNRGIRYDGLSHWLNRIWSKYFAQTFYFIQPDEVYRRFSLQILRSPMISPKPRIVEIYGDEPRNLIPVIWRLIKTGSLEIERESILAEQLSQSFTDDKKLLPAVHALGCCLMGIERYPWRKPYEQPIREVLVA